MVTNPLVERKQSPQTNSWKFCNIVTCGCFLVVSLGGFVEVTHTFYIKEHALVQSRFFHTFFAGLWLAVDPPESWTRHKIGKLNLSYQSRLIYAQGRKNSFFKGQI